MMNSTLSWWAAAAASAMTLAIGVAIGALAQVEAGGLPVVRLERVEVLGKAPLAGGNEFASSEARSRRTL